MGLHIYDMSTGKHIVGATLRGTCHGLLWKVTKSGVALLLEQRKDGGSTSTADPMPPSWTQQGAHLEGSPGNPLATTGLRMMTGFSAPVGSDSCGCPLIGGWVRRIGYGAGGFLRCCILNYQSLSFWSHYRSGLQLLFLFLSHPLSILHYGLCLIYMLPPLGSPGRLHGEISGIGIDR